MREGRVARVGESGACDVSGARVDSILSGGSVATHVRVRVRARVTVVWAVAGGGGARVNMLRGEMRWRGRSCGR